MSSETSSPESGSGRIIPGVVIAGFCVFLQLYAPQPLLVLFHKEFNASEARVSLIVSAATLAVALASPFVGVVADAVGRKRVIVPCLVALAASTLGCALSSDLNQIILWRLLGGICTPGVIAVTLAYISEESPAMSAGAVTALYVTGTVLGGLTGRLSAAFAADHLSWRWSFGILSLLTLIGTACVQLLLPRSQKFIRQTHWREPIAAMWQHLHNKSLLATYLAGFTVLFCHVGLFTYINFYLAKPPYSLSTSALGSLFLVYALGIIITPMSGKLVDRAGHRTGILLGTALIIIGAVATLIPNLWSIIAGIATASSGVFVGQATASSHIGCCTQTARSAASGLYVASYYLGGSVGATALVVPWHMGGWSAVVFSLIAMQLITTGLTWRFFAPGRPAQHGEPIPIE